MEIRIGDLKLTAAARGTSRATTIIITNDLNTDAFEIDSNELKAAIEALEKTCWRP